jgi:hypothetical protein
VTITQIPAQNDHSYYLLLLLREYDNIQNIHTATTAVVARFKSSWSGARLSVWRRLFRRRFFFAFPPLDCPSPFQPQSRLPLLFSYTPSTAGPLTQSRARASAVVPKFPLGCARYILGVVVNASNYYAFDSINSAFA